MLDEPASKKAKKANKGTAKPEVLSIAISDSDLKEKFIELYFYHKEVGQLVRDVAPQNHDASISNQPHAG